MSQLCQKQLCPATVQDQLWDPGSCNQASEPISAFHWTSPGPDTWSHLKGRHQPQSLLDPDSAYQWASTRPASPWGPAASRLLSGPAKQQPGASIQAKSLPVKWTQGQPSLPDHHSSSAHRNRRAHVSHTGKEGELLEHVALVIKWECASGYIGHLLHKATSPRLGNVLTYHI